MGSNHATDIESVRQELRQRFAFSLLALVVTLLCHPTVMPKHVAGPRKSEFRGAGIMSSISRCAVTLLVDLASQSEVSSCRKLMYRSAEVPIKVAI